MKNGSRKVPTEMETIRLYRKYKKTGWAFNECKVIIEMRLQCTIIWWLMLFSINFASGNFKVKKKVDPVLLKRTGDKVKMTNGSMLDLEPLARDFLKGIEELKKKILNLTIMSRKMQEELGKVSMKDLADVNSFEDAEKYCHNRLQGHLLSISNREEHQFLQNLLLPHNTLLLNAYSTIPLGIKGHPKRLHFFTDGTDSSYALKACQIYSENVKYYLSEGYENCCYFLARHIPERIRIYTPAKGRTALVYIDSCSPSLFQSFVCKSPFPVLGFKLDAIKGNAERILLENINDISKVIEESSETVESKNFMTSFRTGRIYVTIFILCVVSVIFILHFFRLHIQRLLLKKKVLTISLPSSTGNCVTVHSYVYATPKSVHEYCYVHKEEKEEIVSPQLPPTPPPLSRLIYAKEERRLWKMKAKKSYYAISSAELIATPADVRRLEEVFSSSAELKPYEEVSSSRVEMDDAFFDSVNP